jgi:hypothetical protein
MNRTKRLAKLEAAKSKAARARNLAVSIRWVTPGAEAEMPPSSAKADSVRINLTRRDGPPAPPACWTAPWNRSRPNRPNLEASGPGGRPRRSSRQLRPSSPSDGQTAGGSVHRNSSRRRRSATCARCGRLNRERPKAWGFSS